MNGTTKFQDLLSQYFSLQIDLNKEIKKGIVNIIGPGDEIDLTNSEDRICIDDTPHACEYEDMDLLECISVTEHGDIEITSTYGECDFDDISLDNKIFIYEYLCKLNNN